jgi:anti-sigma factor RsiW
MTCRELMGFLDDYVDGALAARERLGFEAHLAECPECIAYVRSYRDTIRLSKDTFSDTADPHALGMPDELVDAILASRRRRSH